MYSFLRPWTYPVEEAKPLRTDGRVLSFDPVRLIQAIAFHLLDEGKAHAVSTESCRDVAMRLALRFDRLTIPADLWAAMDNPQRLHWLLDQSHVRVSVKSCGSAILSVHRL
jgi:hypothetical protein